MVAGAVGVLRRRRIGHVRRAFPCVLLVLGLAGCGGGGGPHRQHRPAHAPPPAAPISPRALTLGGRIVIVNGWEGVVTGQRLRVAAGRYASSREGVALVSDAGDLEREVRAPPRRGRAALPAPQRSPARAALAQGPPLLAGPSHPAARATRRRRGLPARRAARPAAAPAPALHAAWPATAPSAAFGQVRRAPRDPRRRRRPGHGNRGAACRATPPAASPSGHSQRACLSRTPRPIVSIFRRTVLLSRFSRGWRAWRVQG